jgi:hypothetical protein
MLTLVYIGVTNINYLSHISYNSVLCVIWVYNVIGRCKAVLIIFLNFLDLDK